jgi:hypothetical protein
MKYEKNMGLMEYIAKLLGGGGGSNNIARYYQINFS